jgi:hypothetical protein
MRKLREGTEVIYAGPGDRWDEGLALGDTGQVMMAAGGGGSHVMWDTGERAGLITLTANNNLAVEGEEIPSEVPSLTRRALAGVGASAAGVGLAPEVSSGMDTMTNSSMDTMQEPPEEIPQVFVTGLQHNFKRRDVSPSAIVGPLVKNRLVPSPAWIQEKMKFDLRMRLKEDPEVSKNVALLTPDLRDQEVIWDALVARLLRDAFSV